MNNLAQFIKQLNVGKGFGFEKDGIKLKTICIDKLGDGNCEMSVPREKLTFVPLQNGPFKCNNEGTVTDRHGRPVSHFESYYHFILSPEEFYPITKLIKGIEKICNSSEIIFEGERATENNPYVVDLANTLLSGFYDLDESPAFKSMEFSALIIQITDQLLNGEDKVVFYSYLFDEIWRKGMD